MSRIDLSDDSCNKDSWTPRNEAHHAEHPVPRPASCAVALA